MASTQQVADTTNEILVIVDELKGIIESLVPASTAPIELAEVFAKLATKALAGWSQAAGTPITVENLQALLPNPEPLTPPTA